MNLEDIMLSEMGQTQQDKHCLIPLRLKKAGGGGAAEDGREKKKGKKEEAKKKKRKGRTKLMTHIATWIYLTKTT